MASKRMTRLLCLLLAWIALSLSGCGDDESEEGEAADATTTTTTAASGDCACIYQGSELAADTYNSYPADDPGKYNTYESIKVYGTTCAAWDAIPGTPWFSYCPGNASFGTADYNWCQQPWCYVDSSCSSAVGTSVFAGSSTTHYSYLTCGSAADCYTNIAWNDSYSWPAGCPYDPYSTTDYKVFKTGSCSCLYHGQLLASDIYTNYPAQDPGKYASNGNIKIYGTSCAAWDQVPETPWASDCPSGSDWCNKDYNWCQLPWCYVDSSCATGVSTSVFNGSTTTHYSYDTCLGTPDCYTDIAWGTTDGAPQGCPFDQSSSGWYTAKNCSDGWSDSTSA